MQTVGELERNIRSRRETDRIMWFSMWLLLSIVSFGIAWFMMTYLSIKRRNDHFVRQAKLEKLILYAYKQLYNGEQIHKQNYHCTKIKSEAYRHARVWTIATLFFFPALYVYRFLDVDLQRHEEDEYRFLKKISQNQKYGPKLNLECFEREKGTISSENYLLSLIATCGFVFPYWLYKLFNAYNNHFKRQWEIEDELLNFLKKSKVKNSNTLL